MKSSYALGLFYIVLVSIIWSAASILVQYLYEGLDFDSPFLLTYIGTSLFIILIPGYLIHQSRRKIRNTMLYCCTLNINNNDVVDDIDDENDDVGLEQPQTSTEGTPLSLHPDESNDSIDIDDVYMINPADSDGDDEAGRFCNNGNGIFLSHLEHLRMAAKIAPWWFVSNYFYNLSLKYTTITSSTVLASTGSIFTFVFSLIWGDETFNGWKFLGVVLAFIGSFITSSNDANNSASSNVGDDTTSFEGNGHIDPFPYQLWGDVAGIISAMGYGVYTVLVRILCHDESKMSMNLFLGYVGLLNMIALSPIAWWSVAKISKDEDAPDYYDESSSSDTGDYISPQHLTWFVVFCLIVKGLFDNVLSDYLWARSIILTSATVATVGLGLTIPLALVSDLFIMERDNVWTLQSVAGATLVLSGFVFVNLGEDAKEDVHLIDTADDDDEHAIVMS